MNRFTRSVAMASARHPWRTIASWLVVTAAVFALAGAIGGTFTDDFSSPGSQSARALDLLNQSFPEANKGKALVVLASEDGRTRGTTSVGSTPWSPLVGNRRRSAKCSVPL